MNLTRPPWSKRPTLLSGVLALTLIGCTNNTPPEPVTPPPPAAEAPDAGLPDDALVALVHGDVSSPIYDALKDRLTLVSYDGSQKAADHDVLIFDGDHHDPAEHAKHPLVDEALSAGKWVLGVDVDEAHKEDSLGERIGASTEGGSHSYLVRTEADARGRPSVWIVESVENAAPVTTGEGATVQRAETAPLRLEDAGDFAAGITERLNGVVPPSRDLTPQQNENVPPGLVYKTITYTPQLPLVDLGAAIKNSSNGTQRARTEASYVFNLYFSNADNPNGDFQYVAVETDILADVDNFGDLACDGCYTGAASGGYADEYAWFMGRQRTYVGPAGGDGSLFKLVASSPADTSNASEYTSSLNFDVGFRYEGKEESFPYSTSEVVPLTDWRLTNESDGTTAAWHFRTATPWNGDQIWEYGVTVGNSVQTNDGWYNGGYPKEPNVISKDGPILSTKALWKSSAVLDRTVAFELETAQLFLDAYCDVDILLECQTGSSLVAFNDGLGLDRVLNIDMGAVTVPVAQFKELAFAYSPWVEAGWSDTGFLVLTDVAPRDLTFNLSSDSPNAVVADKTTLLEKGKAAGSFGIATNALQLPPGAPL